MSNDFQSYLNNGGIRHGRTCAYASQQNEIAERLHRALLDLARFMHQETSLNPMLWTEAVVTAAYILSRLPSRAISLRRTLY